MSTVAKQEKVAQAGFVASLFQSKLYKPTQGRVVRQVTAVAIGIVALLAAYELAFSGWVISLGRNLNFEGMSYVVLLLFAVAGIWFAFRVVNVPRFADFLIAVEAEMKKVSWPGRAELWRASMVVIFVIFAMAALLWVFDAIWTLFFRWINIRYG